MDHPRRRFGGCALFLLVVHLGPPPAASAEDIAGAVEHPMVTPYPEQEIRWQQIENLMPYRVPVGPSPEPHRSPQHVSVSLPQDASR